MFNFQCQPFFQCLITNLWSEGEDSIRFNKLLEKTKDKKVSKEDRERSMAIYKAVLENQK